MTTNGKIYYYLVNHHGDVMALTDDAGNVAASYSYDTWGNILSQSGIEKLAEENPYRYAGYRYDENTKLYYLMARYYNSDNGVFLSIDPIRGDIDNPISLNGYNYVSNNPVMLFDPDGMKQLETGIGGGGGVPYNLFLKLTGKGTIKATGKAWIQKGIYNDMKNKLGNEAAQKFSNAMKKGFVKSGKGDNGIKRLSGKGVKVGNTYYQYEIKITGKYGNARVYGNLDEKSGHIIFKSWVKSH